MEIYRVLMPQDSKAAKIAYMMLSEYAVLRKFTVCLYDIRLKNVYINAVARTLFNGYEDCGIEYNALLDLNEAFDILHAPLSYMFNNQPVTLIDPNRFTVGDTIFTIPDLNAVIGKLLRLGMTRVNENTLDKLILLREYLLALTPPEDKSTPAPVTTPQDIIVPDTKIVRATTPKDTNLIKGKYYIVLPSKDDSFDTPLSRDNIINDLSIYAKERGLWSFEGYEQETKDLMPCIGITSKGITFESKEFFEGIGCVRITVFQAYNILVYVKSEDKEGWRAQFE